MWSGFDKGDDFVPLSGTFDNETNSQVGTLTVKQNAVTSDKTYTCTVESLSNPASDRQSFDVHLNVYGMLFCVFVNIIHYYNVTVFKLHLSPNYQSKYISKVSFEAIILKWSQNCTNFMKFGQKWHVFCKYQEKEAAPVSETYFKRIYGKFRI